MLKILRNLLLLTVNDCDMAVLKKTGLYGIERIYPRSIHDLRVGDKVVMRTKGEIDREYGGGCFESPLVGPILMTETMQEALGGTLTVGIVDDSDDTVNAYMDGLDYWWPLKAVEYIIR